MIPQQTLPDIWVVVFAGITACSPILVALIARKWGRSVGRTKENINDRTNESLDHALDVSLIEHHKTQEMLRDQNVEMRSHFDRILRYVLPTAVPVDMIRLAEELQKKDAQAPDDRRP